ncbi:hypothetical protein G7Z17_g7119 [Cylindrodendrum hubeiense]|uniref:DUF3295 domain-containing protein n=1 Tax=Cylindrodendrum hubeiense TaxID=595255 RepID=A0A9P5H635_9HYPO|nr:hypothetical protein G7Z17_g7119 [Cylindrodendrum hubeiense]
MTARDYIDDNAVDDGDSDWESDGPEQAGKAFQRMPCRKAATTPSLISIGLAKRSSTPGNGTPQPAQLHHHANHSIDVPEITEPASQPDSDPSEDCVMMKPTRPRKREVLPIRSRPIAIRPRTTQDSPYNSPGTNRRDMLTSELPESLRRHMLWERQQKSSTVNAVLKRRHTLEDVPKLKQEHATPCPNPIRSFQEFRTVCNGYHDKGW